MPVPKRRSLLTSTALAIVAILAMQATTMAATLRSAALLDRPGNVHGIQLEGDFRAQWLQTRSSVWVFDDFQMTAYIPNGKACPVTICEAWVLSAQVRFYNASNAQVGSVVNITPAGWCYGGLTGPNDIHLARCNPYTFTVNVAAVKAKLTWQVRTLDNGIWTVEWNQTSGYISL